MNGTGAPRACAGAGRLGRAVLPLCAAALRCGLVLLCAAAGARATAGAAAGLPGASSPGPIVTALDHIPIVVADLEAAVARYRELGFVLKPGRPHANGLRNAHVKFPDGAGLELITAPRAVDGLTTRYRELLKTGEGPAFLALRAPDLDRLVAALRAGGWQYQRERDLVELRHPGLEFLFFVRGNRSPTDRPEHFAHPNGAMALAETRLALAPDAAGDLERLLGQLGGVTRPGQPGKGKVIELATGAIALAPYAEQRLPERPIVCAALLARDLATVRALLADVTVAPESACGLRLQFR